MWLGCYKGDNTNSQGIAPTARANRDHLAKSCFLLGKWMRMQVYVYTKPHTKIHTRTTQHRHSQTKKTSLYTHDTIFQKTDVHMKKSWLIAQFVESSSGQMGQFMTWPGWRAETGPAELSDAGQTPGTGGGPWGQMAIISPCSPLLTSWDSCHRSSAASLLPSSKWVSEWVAGLWCRQWPTE